MRGTRPDRPPSGLSNTLWELLEAMWVVQHAQEPLGRPPARIVLDRLKECVDHWGQSIIPIIPESWQESGYHMSPSKCCTLFMFLLQRQALKVLRSGRTRWQVIFFDRVDYPAVDRGLRDLTLGQSSRDSLTYTASRLRPFSPGFGLN